MIGLQSYLPQTGYFEEKGDHAGEMETSVMIALLSPELVNLQLAGDGVYTPFKSETLRDGTGWAPRNWAQASHDTGTGNPKKSTVGKGKVYAESC